MPGFMFIFINFVPIIIAIVIHEIAHGFVASLYGDNTAKEHKRLSINPINHFDLFGTIIIPAILIFSKIGFVFGWAKPVIINYKKLKQTKLAFFMVVSAGIFANILLAIISALILKLSVYIYHPYIHLIFNLFWLNMVAFNIALALFNLLPLPPLDGSKMFFGWINKPWSIRYINSEKTGFALIVTLGFILPIIGKSLGFNLNFLGSYLINTSQFLISILI